MEHILITGGAGFIGSRTARRFLENGYKVRILDNLLSQVHGDNADVPSWMRSDCDVIIDNICNKDILHQALKDIDIVVHLAAETGPAQSMYEITRYCDSNLTGTANLLQELLNSRDRIQKLVVASSRAVYGEGKYQCPDCGVVYPNARREDRLSLKLWEPDCPHCGGEINSVATDENSLPKPTSIYAVTKLSQEQLCLVTGDAYGIPTVSLRYQNVYGPGQSMTNPYIGVLAIFAARIKSGAAIQIFEDGKESRDFVHVDDVVHATYLAALSGKNYAGIYNVGSGQPTTLMDTAYALADAMNTDVDITVSGRYRVGDIRHCYADLTKIRRDLGYCPQVPLKEGLRDLAVWASDGHSFTNELDKANEELKNMGLFK